MHGDRFEKYPIGKIDQTNTWKVGEKVCAPIYLHLHLQGYLAHKKYPPPNTLDYT